MGEVTVVTDSTQYLEAETLAKAGIEVVSLYVLWQGRQDRETELGGFGAFYDHLRAGGELPKTAAPSVGDFLEVYQPLLDAGRDVVSVHLSGGISGTVGIAAQARDVLVEQGIDPARIEVVDGETACGGLGLIALAGAAAARGGADVATVAARIREARASMQIWVAVDTLEFLKRGGRIGAAQAWFGTALKVKPILTLGREITPVERVRTSRKAFEKLVECLTERREARATAWAVQHIQAADQVQRLVERGEELFGHPPLMRSEVGPVIGTHVGPGLLGAAGIPPHLLEP